MKYFFVTVAAVLISVSLHADIVVKPSRTVGPVKLMNAVNNGPEAPSTDQNSSNFEYFKALNIPYARTHDANFSAYYGAPHTVDITAIFPDFSKDENDPESYDFTHTDLYLYDIMEAGAKVFFRLGQMIEHAPKKYGVMPPVDYHKWARICEHIIRHYNEGWANGYKAGIEYWEIWNEPDLDAKTWKTNPRCWGGTPEEFFKFYEIAAKHLDSCFPELKIGGPALAGNLDWGEKFLAYMQEHKVPMDFFSWHIYTVNPVDMAKKSAKVRLLMDKYGYKDAESILNEWNYVKGWNKEFIYSLKVMRSMKGAAFTAAVMQACQNAPVDMLMYYDFRVDTAFNGAFDTDTHEPLKGYYPFYAWNKLLEYGTQVEVECGEEDKDIFATAARSDDGKLRLMLTRYNADDNKIAPKVIKVKVEGVADGTVYAHVTDYITTYTEVPLEVVNGEISIMIQPLSFMVIDL